MDEPIENEPLMKLISAFTFPVAKKRCRNGSESDWRNDEEPQPWDNRTADFRWKGLDLPHFEALRFIDPTEEDFHRALDLWRNGPDNQPTFNPAARLEALQNRSKPLLLFGPSGSGKTTVAAELWMMWTMVNGESEGRIGFVTGRQFCNSISPLAKANAVGPYMEAIQNLDFLILDDIGATKYTERCAEELLDLISARLHRYDCQTIITMNTDSRGLAERLEARDYHSKKITNRSTVESILRRLRTDFQCIDFSKATTESEA